jgi:Rps23 Pro-64 3,4-dihydroxylase Tpa1-like proline 4-hydroxylase
MRISKYKEGEFFSAHPDDSYGTPRTVSMVYYPNDDYEGGELEFLHFGVKIKPKAGQLFMFPSAYSYEHKIYSVTGGNERYTFVTFFNHISESEKAKRLSELPELYQTNLQYMFDPMFSKPSNL